MIKKIVLLYDGIKIWYKEKIGFQMDSNLKYTVFWRYK